MKSTAERLETRMGEVLPIKPTDRLRASAMEGRAQMAAPYDRSRRRTGDDNHVLVKKKIVKNTDGNANCVAAKDKLNGMSCLSCKHNGHLTVRKRKFLSKRNLEPGEDGCYPDWSRTSTGKYVNEKVVKHMGDAQRRCLALVQNGHPMKAVNTQHEAVLGVSEVAARAFSKKCFCNEEAGDCSYLKTAEVYLVQIIPRNAVGATENPFVG